MAIYVLHYTKVSMQFELEALYFNAAMSACGKGPASPPPQLYLSSPPPHFSNLIPSNFSYPISTAPCLSHFLHRLPYSPQHLLIYLPRAMHICAISTLECIRNHIAASTGPAATSRTLTPASRLVSFIGDGAPLSQATFEYLYGLRSRFRLHLRPVPRPEVDMPLRRRVRDRLTVQITHRLFCVDEDRPQPRREGRALHPRW